MPQRPLSETFRGFLLPDVHPPLHYMIMWAWQIVAPSTDAAMRLPRLLAWILTVLAASFYPSRAMTEARRCAFAALLACSFGTLYFAQEVRSYYLFELLAVLLLYEMLDLAVALRDGEAPGLARLARFVVVGTVASYTHYFAFLFAGTTVLALLAYALMLRRAPWRIGAAGLAIAAAVAPWMLIHVRFLGTRLGGQFWIGNELLVVGLRGVGRHLFGSVAGLVAVAGLALWGLAVRRWQAWRQPALWLLGIVVTVNLVLPLIVSIHTPVVTAKNLTGLRVALLLAMALPIADALADRRAAALLVATAVILFVSFLATQKPRPSWREPIAHLLAQTDCAHREILHYTPPGSGNELLEWYLRDPRIVVRASAFDAAIVDELRGLNPVAPGCDVVALALDLDPVNLDRREAALAATPFRGPGYHITEWPSAIVVRRIVP